MVKKKIDRSRRGMMDEFGATIDSLPAELHIPVWKKGEGVKKEGESGKILGSEWDSIKEARLYDFKGKKSGTSWGYASQFTSKKLRGVSEMAIKRNYKIQGQLSTGKWATMSSHRSKKHAQEYLKKRRAKGNMPYQFINSTKLMPFRIKKIISKGRK